MNGVHQSLNGMHEQRMVGKWWGTEHANEMKWWFSSHLPPANGINCPPGAPPRGIHGSSPNVTMFSLAIETRKNCQSGANAGVQHQRNVPAGSRSYLNRPAVNQRGNLPPPMVRMVMQTTGSRETEINKETQKMAEWNMNSNEETEH